MSVIALQYVKLGQLQSLIFTVVLLNSEANFQAIKEAVRRKVETQDPISFLFFLNQYVWLEETL